jgi:hypothetical protein
MGLQGRSSDGEPKYVQSLVDRFGQDGSDAMKESPNQRPTYFWGLP